MVRTCVERGHVRCRRARAVGVPGARRAVAVSEYTARPDRRPRPPRSTPGTAPGSPPSARSGCAISYPAIDVAAYLDAGPGRDRQRARATWAASGTATCCSCRAWPRAKGVDDLIDGLRAQPPRLRASTWSSPAPARRPTSLHARAAQSPVADRIVFLDDVDDAEKAHLMAGCAAFALPSKPRPEFVETFGIALVEKMLSGGGPVITTDTGGIGEAVGDMRAHRPGRRPGRDRRGARPRCWPCRRSSGRTGSGGPARTRCSSTARWCSTGCSAGWCSPRWPSSTAA